MAHPRSLVLSLALGFALATTALPARAVGVVPSRATPAQREQAQARFVKGKDHQTAGRYEAAIAELSASLEVVASPNTRLVLARCHRELGHLVVAYNELGRATSEARELARDDPKYEKTADAALAERTELAAKLGLLEVGVANAEPTTTLRVAGEDVPRSAWSEPVATMPGETEVVVETPGKPPIKKSVSAQAGQKVAVSVDAAPAPAAGPTEPSKVDMSTAKPTSLRPLAYVAGGVAVVGLGTFVVAGLMSRSTYSDLEGACPGGTCPKSRAEDISQGKTEQTIANVGLVVGLVGAAAGVTLFVLSRPKDRAAAMLPTTRVVARPSSFTLEGTF